MLLKVDPSGRFTYEQPEILICKSINSNEFVFLMFSFVFFSVPSLVDSLTTPLVVAEGHDAAITCVVRNIANYTVLWRGQQDR